MKQIKTISNLKWYYGGTLLHPKDISGGGVYLLVHKGNPQRIVYVGTTMNFNHRWHEHSENMKRGNRAVWRVTSSEDIYELMSYKGSGITLNTTEIWHLIKSSGLRQQS